uniref:MARVEL domain-containing protein n=1 Tax=Heterorhabditis bacteriophora TaxID=37862 RepID=A0A1I7WT58_HETBA
MDYMHDPRYTTTTTVVETREYVADDGPSVRVGLPSFDCSYIRTLGGMMKCICIALCLLCFLCVLIGGPGFNDELIQNLPLSFYFTITGAGWATFVSTVGLSVSTTLLFLYIFRVVDALPQVSWIVGVCYLMKLRQLYYFIPNNIIRRQMALHMYYVNNIYFILQEMCFYFAWTIFFFIAACVLAVAASRFSGAAGWGAAAFFAFGAMCAYGFDCYLKFLSWKNNEVGYDFLSQSVEITSN